MPRRNENGSYPIPLLTTEEYRKEMRIKERVAASVANMNRTDSKGNLLTLVPAQEAERFVRRHGVGPTGLNETQIIALYTRCV